MHLSIHTDGGSRGNPGHAGFGFVVYNSAGDILHQDSQYIGIKTNNEAEYAGLLSALTWLQDYSKNNPVFSVDFFMDSQLIVRQVQGAYKVKATNLIPIFNQIKSLLSSFSFPVRFTHVLRHKNKIADQLANLAMDHGQKNQIN